jgi:hypothetical protein
MNSVFNTICEWFMVNSFFLNLNKTFSGRKVFRMHKYIIRIKMGCKRREPCWHLFRKLKILPLPSQYILSLLLFVMNNRNQFTINSEIHSINSREFSHLHQPRYSLCKYQEVLLTQTHTTVGIWYMYDMLEFGIQFEISSQSSNICVLNFIHQHSHFLGTVPDLEVWTVILLLLSWVGQWRALVPNGLFAVVKQWVHDFLVVQRKANPK